jgi:hypothetical protein
LRVHTGRRAILEAIDVESGVTCVAPFRKISVTLEVDHIPKSRGIGFDLKEAIDASDRGGGCVFVSGGQETIPTPKNLERLYELLCGGPAANGKNPRQRTEEASRLIAGFVGKSSYGNGASLLELMKGVPGLGTETVEGSGGGLEIR